MTSFWLLQVNKYDDSEHPTRDEAGIFSTKEKAKQALIDAGIQVDWESIKGFTTEKGEDKNQSEWWLTEWELDQLEL